MILFRFNGLDILVDMSLTKAAEVLNKILYNNENLNGLPIPTQSISIMPPILLPPERLSNSHELHNQETKNTSESLFQNGKIWKYAGNEINEIPFKNVNGINTDTGQFTVTTDIKATPVSTKEICFTRDTTDLNVVTVSRNSSVYPLIEQIFNGDGNSMTVGSLSNIEYDEFTPLDPSKYKTELCRSYQVHGYCKYGVRCNYAHGLTQIRVAYRHGKYKTRNCQSYHETGFCRYGARCSFIHDAEEGILKCPITDREVLEALHYRPMSEFHHIATITWRMIGHDSYPPTEVHFFTPSIGNKITEISDGIICKGPYFALDEKSLPEEINKAEDGSCEEVLEVQVSKPSCKSLINKIDIASFNFCVDQSDKHSHTNLSKETNFENIENSVENFEHSSHQNIFSVENLVKPERNFSLIGEATENNSVAKENKEMDKPSDLRNSKPEQKGKNSCDKIKQVWTKNSNSVEKNSNYSVAFKNFNLDDFLNCLKTREGQQHLASWVSESERRNSCGTSDESSSQRSTHDYSCKRQTVRSGRDLSKYKTELCRSYQYNKYCEYNESCLYAHGTEDLRSYPKHPLYRTKKCFSFHKKGFCLYGSRCQFLHDIEVPLLH